MKYIYRQRIALDVDIFSAGTNQKYKEEWIMALNIRIIFKPKRGLYREKIIKI